jgi:RNA polymerase sigma-70 factor, ECF subfamily
VVQIDDRVLVRAAQAGDLDAFEMLVRRYQPSVYRIALRLLGSDADADDVAQDTFLRAWRSLPQFRGDSTFATWLYRIVTRRSLDTLARRRPINALEDDVPAPTSDPVMQVEQRERLQAITRQIQRLPAEQRAALVLREFEGLSYEQVADVLETSVGAIKSRIHRARLAVLKETTAWR